MARYLIDTNLLLRSVQENADQHGLAVKSVRVMLAQGNTLYVTPQVLIEFWAVASRPVDANGLGWSTEMADAEISRLKARFLLLEDVAEVFDHWLELVRDYHVRGKRTHDTRLVAVMQAHGVENLLTFNVDDFAAFKEINAVHPASVK